MTAFQDNITQYNVMVGAANKALASVAPSATSGIPVISQGASANPAFGTAVVAGGGTGLATLTAYGLIAAGTTSTGNLQQISTGTSGQILRAGGAGALAGWSTATYPATAGTSGNVLTSDGTNWTSTAPSGSYLTSTTTITSAQIKALHATPIQLIAAPGSGKVIRIINIIGKMTYGGTNAFTGAAAQVVSVRYNLTTPTSIGSAVFQLAAITATSSQLAIIAPASASGNGNAYTLYDNAAIVAYQSQATEIGGNAANNNTMTFSIIYEIVTI